MTEPSVLLLYDGLCGFCDGTVQFLLRRDPGGSMKFASLQGETAADIKSRHRWLEEVDSLVLVTRRDGEESVRVRSEAALGVAEYLGGLWSTARVMRLLPRGARDRAYATFARHRFRIFRRREACRVPGAEERSRFLP